MDWEDTVYLVLLISSVAFGKVLRQIEDKKTRKDVSTFVGFAIVFVTSGVHILHPIALVVGNWVIIKYLKKKNVHSISFIFSFLYLVFFRTTEYFGISYPPGQTNLIQMILTLKLVGLAFELHDTRTANMAGKSSSELDCSRIPEPDLIEMFHYSFCYIGVITGPYFSYRCYWDMFNRPFSDNAPCLQATLDRAKYLPLYAVGFLLSSYFFPLKYVETSDFKEQCSLWYRLFYILPCFFTFRMRMYIGMRLSECVFTMSGLGAYPAVTLPKPGKGPSTNFGNLVTISVDDERAKEAEYSFETIHNIEPWGAEFEYTVRSSMKSWNMTVQYWLATYVYRRFPIKAFRMPATFLVSSFWHGIYAGHYMCLCSVPFYLPIEDRYVERFKGINLSPKLGKLWFVVAYTWRMLLMGYWGVAFSLLYVQPAFSFWVSVYFIPSLITVLMYLALPRQQKVSLKKT
ncbi:hypothetical protein AAG570_004576 [Ranatra chinensis]|uniref:Lysophospholipid acyltransferase 7 n=1 Tax=Ranatra chinensis TaxID=642074 RepID=A0ABD0Y3J8_9HEMI